MNQVPYSAKLLSVFADGKTKRRLIRGTYVETLLTDVEAEYGRPFYTRNGTGAPTTTTPATTTTASTTTHNDPLALKEGNSFNCLSSRPVCIVRYLASDLFYSVTSPKL